MSKWTVGQKKQRGTYHPDTIYDENGNSILTVYGIASNSTLEDLGERDAEGLRIARMVVSDHNAQSEIITLQQHVINLLKIVDTRILPDEDDRAAIEQAAEAVGYKTEATG